MPLNLPKNPNNNLNQIKKDYQTIPIDYQTAVVSKRILEIYLIIKYLLND